MKFTVIYERGETSWGAYVPDLPGVIAVGDSRADAKRLIQEAMALHIQGLRSEGLAVPAAASFAGIVEVETAYL